MFPNAEGEETAGLLLFSQFTLALSSLGHRKIYLAQLFNVTAGFSSECRVHFIPPPPSSFKRILCCGAISDVAPRTCLAFSPPFKITALLFSTSCEQTEGLLLSSLLFSPLLCFPLPSLPSSPLLTYFNNSELHLCTDLTAAPE